jgi:hypothetical protein
MSPLVVGEDKVFKTMALCTYNKVYNQKVLFIAFFYFHYHTLLLRPLSLYAYTHMVHTSASCQSQQSTVGLPPDHEVCCSFQVCRNTRAVQSPFVVIMVTLPPPPVTRLQLLSYHQ